MSKRDRYLKQRLDELFSSPAEAPAEQPAGITPAREPAAPDELFMLKTAVERLPLPAYLKDREHHWLAVNAAFAQLLSQAPEALLGRADEEQADEAWQLDDHVLATGHAQETEEIAAMPDGTVHVRHTRRTPLLNAQKEVAYVMGVMQESSTKAVAAPQPESEAAFRAVIDATPSPVIISRISDDVILYANPAFGTFANVALEEVIGQPATRFYVDLQDRERVAQGVQQLGVLHGLEARMRRVDGFILWVSLSIRRIKFQGQACVIMTLVDISARKKVEEELIKFKLGIDRSYYSVMITSADGTILYVNPAFTKIYGYTAEEAVGRRPSLLKSGQVTAEQYERFWEKLLAGEVITGEIINKSKAGRLIPVETNNSPILDDNGQIIGFISMQSDISVRKQAETDLRKFRQGMERSNAAIFMTDPQGVITYVNPAFERIYGFTRAEAIGQTPRILKSGRTTLEQYQYFWSTLLAGQSVVGEIINRAKDGRLVQIEGSNNPILDDDGNIIGFLALHSDISLRKQAEADLLTRNKQLAVFNRLGQELAQLTSVQEIVDHVFEAMGELLDNRNLYIALYNERKQEITFPVYTIAGERRAVAARSFGNGMTEYVLHTRQTLLIPRKVQDFAASQQIDSSGQPSKCYLGVPLLSGDKALGVIALQDYEREDVYSAAEVDLLSVLAAQTATALENVRLYAAEAQRAVQLQTAAEISTTAGTILNLDELLPFVVNLIQQRFGLYYVGLFLLDDQQEHAVLRAGTGTAGQLMQERRHQLFIDDRSMIGWCIQQRVPRVALDVGEDAVHFDNPDLSETRSELALPLLSRGQVLGAITIQSREAGAFSEQDIAILQTMSDQVAITIGNAQLFEQASLARQQAEMRLRETQFLQKVGQTVSSSLDLSNVLDVVMETLQDEMGFTHNALYLVDKQAGLVSTPRASGTAAQLQGLTRSLKQLQNDILMDILNKGQIELIDGWDDRLDREIYEKQGHAALVRAFVPLRLRNESIGLLEVGYRRAVRARITPEEVHLLGGLADQIAVAVGNARLFRISQQRITELSVVNEISRTLTAAQDIRQLFATIHQQVGRLFEASSFYIATYDGGEEWSLDYQIEHGQLQPPTRHALKGGFTSYILQTGKPILIRSALEDQHFHVQQNLPELGEQAKSWMGVPLVVGGSVIGAMGIQSYDQEGLYSEQDVALFSTIGTQIAAAVQNARLLEEARQRAAELTALNELSQTLTAQLSVKQVVYEVWQGVSQLLDTTNFYIALYDPARKEVSFPINASESMLDKEIETMPADRGLTGYILRTRQPLLITEGANKQTQDLGLETIGGDSQSYLGVPLILGDQVLGVMAIQSYTRARLYGHHDLELMMAIAGQAAIAVQNARLFEQTQRNTRQLVALNEFGQAVSQQIEIEQVLEVTYQRLQLLAPIDAFFAILYDPDSNTISFPVVYDEGKRYQEPSGPLHPDSNAGQVIMTGNPILKLLTPEELASTTEVEGAVGNVNRLSASLLYVPLKVGIQIIGVLSIQSYQINAYNEDTVQLIGNVANQAAIAIQNARLFSEIRQRSTELATLNQIFGSVTQTLELRALLDAVLKQTLESFGFDGGLITIYNEDRGKLERIVRTGLPGKIPDDPAEGLENSLCAYVFNTRQALVVEDFRDGAPIDVSGEIEAGYYSYIGLPLEARGHRLGTWCGFRKTAGAFDQHTLPMLQAIGHQLGFAIENAHLFEHVQRTAKREQILRELTARVRGSIDPDIIARTAVRELGQALGRSAFIRLGTAEELVEPPLPQQDMTSASYGRQAGTEGGQ